MYGAWPDAEDVSLVGLRNSLLGNVIHSSRVSNRRAAGAQTTVVTIALESDLEYLSVDVVAAVPA